jgi:hypothetical protein
VAEQLLVIDDEQLTSACKGADGIPGKRAGALVEGNVVGASGDAAPNHPSQIRINVDVCAITLEHKSGLLDFFRNQARMHRLALDRFSVEIVQHAPTGNASELMDSVTDMLRSCDFRGPGASAPGHRVQPTHVVTNHVATNVEEYEPLEFRSSDSGSLDIWV